MKIKPLYMYLGGFIIFIAVMVLLVPKKNTALPNDAMNGQMPNDAVHGQMPNDDVHKGMGSANGMGAMSEAFKKKEAELKDAVDKSPNDTLKVRQYAELLMAAHKPAESLKYLQQIVSKYPNRIDLLLDITYIYDIQGNAGAALETTNKILAVDKNNQPANFNLGVLMDKKGEKDRAKQIWTDLIKKYPGSDIAKLAQQAIDAQKK